MKKSRIAGMFFFSLALLGLTACQAQETKDIASQNVKEIKLEAYQYGYSPERIVVKKGDTVRIYATSRDVPHGVLIKEYAINAVVKKGETKIIEFVAKKAGEFDIRCSVYCGSGHTNMKGKLVVQE